MSNLIRNKRIFTNNGSDGTIGIQSGIVTNYSALPNVVTAANKFYWVSNSQGTAWLPFSLGGTYYPKGLYYSNGVTWEFMETPYQATLATVNTGTNTDQFVTPSTLTNANVVINKATKVTVTRTDSTNSTTYATKVKVNNEGITTETALATTADIADSSNKRYVTDANLTVIGNTSGTNTGDNATNTTSNTYADGKVADAINDGITTIAPSQNAVFDALALKANINSPTLTGTPTAPTATSNINNTQIATTEYLDKQEDLQATGYVSFSPSDGQVIYFASKPGSAMQATNIVRNAFKKTGTIYAATITTSTTLTLGSSETSTVVIRINDTSDSTLSSNILYTARANVLYVTGLNISFSANDDWAIKETFANFGTNPTSVVTMVTLHVRYTS